MKELIKGIRTFSGLTKAQFAEKIGINIDILNRWENENVVPDETEQRSLIDFCREEEINTGLIRIISDAYRYRSDDGSIILYHGSKGGIIGRIRTRSRINCDFGSGFYMGTDPVQPLTLICNKKNPTFYVVKVHTDKLRIKRFDPDLIWAMQVAYHRGYMDDYKETLVYKKHAGMLIGYDLVIGYIANDRLYKVLGDFFGDVITDLTFLRSISVLNLGRQYVCLNQKACNAVEIIDTRDLSSFELSILKEACAVNIKKGNDLADRVAQEYQGQGKYFTQLLEEEKNVNPG